MKDLTSQQALALLELCPTPVLLQDASRRILGCNPAFASLTGSSAEDLGSTNQPDELLAPLLGDSTIIYWVMPDGSERWLQMTHTSLPDNAGSMARYYTDITEALRLRRERDSYAAELGNTALYDRQFNSLLSRHGLQVCLEPLVARNRRYNSPLSLVALGIGPDHAGDRQTVLRQSLALIKDQTRWADLIGCNANQDFLLVLQETSQDAALQLVEKLDARMNRSQLISSYGITSCQKNDDAETLLERVEAALQEARNTGSGRSIAI